MSILNIAGYKFIALAELPELRSHLHADALKHDLKGTLLLSVEGINLMLAGHVDAVISFLKTLMADARFADMRFRKSFSDTCPFERLKVKIRREIITLRSKQADPVARRAPAISPQQFRQWLDEDRPMTVLDTRNDFEVEVGAFKGALNLGLKDFGEFPEAMTTVPRDLPVVMYCTGGIRCEKAALTMMDAGFKEVYQLQDGILGYFAAVGGTHYQGDCFVFDQRVAVDADLQPVTLN